MRCKGKNRYLPSIENNFALPPISEIEKVITPHTKGIVIVNPNNPTGYLYSKEELEQLAVIVKKHDLYLYADEVYREFCYDGYKHFSTMQLAGIEQNVILLDSVSKRYSECGLRVGALVTRNKEVMAAALKFGMARLCAPGNRTDCCRSITGHPGRIFRKRVQRIYRKT